MNKQGWLVLTLTSILTIGFVVGLGAILYTVLGYFTLVALSTLGIYSGTVTIVTSGSVGLLYFVIHIVFNSITKVTD